MRAGWRGGFSALALAASALVAQGADARPQRPSRPQARQPAAPASATPDATRPDGNPDDERRLAAALAASQPVGVTLVRDEVEWIKTCEPGSDQCQVSAGFLLAPGAPATLGLSVGTAPGPAHHVTVLVPLNLNLRAGFVLTLEGQPQGFVGTYGVCRSMGCMGSVDISDGMYGAMLKASAAFVVVQNDTGRTVSLEAPLAGLSQAVAGPAKTTEEIGKVREEAAGRARAAAASAASSETEATAGTGAAPAPADPSTSSRPPDADVSQPASQPAARP